jgi:Protein of unknown function (DUF2975)
MTELPRGLKLMTRLVRTASVLGALFYVAASLYFWTHIDAVRAEAAASTGLPLSAMVIDDRARLLGALASLPNVAITIFAMSQLWFLFGRYAKGHFFAPSTQTYLRRFGWAMLADAITTIAEPTLLGFAYTAGMPAGQHQLVLLVTGDSYLLLLDSAVFLAITLVLSEASRIAEENGQFV